MRKNIKRYSALVVFGMLVLIMCAPSPTAEYWSGGTSSTYSRYVVIDSDNNGNDEAWGVFHDGSPQSTPPGEELFRVQEDGKVGIGMPNPTNKLDVNGSVRVRDLPQDDNLEDIVVVDSDGVLHIRDADTFGEGGSDDDDWFDVTTDSSPTDINADIYTYGDVGIGTPDPTENLDVNGSARVRDLPQDNNIDNIVVADADGVLHTRDIDTIGGEFMFNIITITEDYTPTSSDYTILVDASSKNVKVNLPPAADVPGQILVIKRIDDNKRTTVIIDGDGWETIDGDLRIRLRVKFMSYTIQSDGSDWYIIASYGFMGRSHLKNRNR